MSRISVAPDPNIALRKPVFMSSHWSTYSGPASVVVDGNRGGNFIMTRYESRAWLKIDLLREVYFVWFSYLVAKVNCGLCACFE